MRIDKALAWSALTADQVTQAWRDSGSFLSRDEWKRDMTDESCCALTAYVRRVEAENKRMSDFMTGRVTASPDREYYDRAERAEAERDALRTQVASLNVLLESADRKRVAAEVERDTAYDQNNQIGELFFGEAEHDHDGLMRIVTDMLNERDRYKAKSEALDALEAWLRRRPGKEPKTDWGQGWDAATNRVSSQIAALLREQGGSK